MVLETENLVLKRANYDDWKSIYINLWSRDESVRYMLWKAIHSEEEAQVRMRKKISFMEKNDLTWFVYEKISDQAIGFAGMEQIDDGVYEDTGIAIGPDFVRRGYGKQILKALYDEAFANLGAVKFVGSCRSENIASKELHRSCGFKYTHSLDKIDPRNGKAYTLYYYELLKYKEL